MKFQPKSEETWALGLAVCEELVVANDLADKGLPSSVIAAACDCSEQAVQKIEKRALRKVREALAQKFPELFASPAFQS